MPEPVTHFCAPLILLPPEPSIDLVAAAYGIATMTVYANGTPTIVCATPIAHLLPFIHPIERVFDKIHGIQDFVLLFDETHNPIDDVRINRTNHTLTVTVTPRGDYIDPRDFSFAPSRAHYDHIFLCGTKTCEETHVWNDDAAYVLRDTPVVSLIPDPLHESVTIAALELYNDAPQISSHAAMCFLAGIIHKTNGLRRAPITARLLQMVAALMRAGGDLQTIMLAFYKTVSFDFLKLWGGIIHALVITHNKTIAYAVMTPSDPATHERITDVLRYTTQFIPFCAHTVVLIPESAEQTHIYCVSRHADAFQNLWAPHTPRYLSDKNGIHIIVACPLRMVRIILDQAGSL